MEMVCVTAEAFGYGPIITCVNVIKALAKKINVPFAFLGSGVALEQAKMSGLFSDYIECETHLEDEVRKQPLSETMELDKNIERIGRPIKNFQKVGPLRKFKQVTSLEMNNRILINLGGAESFLEDYSTILRMYIVILRNFFASLNGVFDGEIVVCGGNRITSALGEMFREREVQFRSFGNAKYLVMSPGLGNFYEAMSTGQKVFMLPPINYSQFLQLKKFIRDDIGIMSLNWDEFDWYVRVPDNISEDEGVSLVKKNCDLFIKNPESQKLLCEKMLEYISEDGSDCIAKRKAFIEKCNRNGIDEVSETMARRLEYGNII